MSSRFCFRRVVPAAKDGQKPDEREDVWLVMEWPEHEGLVMEWPEHEAKPSKLIFITIPRRLSKKQVALAGRSVPHDHSTSQRVLANRACLTPAFARADGSHEDPKGELGLDHFEDR